MSSLVAVMLLAASPGALQPVSLHPVSLQYEGPLKEAIKRIATEGELNVVVIGELNEPVQLVLNEASGEEAIESMAKSYGLESIRSSQGGVWVIRKAGTAPEAAPMGSVAAVPPVPVTPVPVTPVPVTPVPVTPVPVTPVPDLQGTPPVPPVSHRGWTDDENKRFNVGGPLVVEGGTTVDEAVAFGGPVTIGEGSVIEGDAVSLGGDVILKKGAIVEGNAVSMGGKVVREEGAVVRGEIVSMGGDSGSTVLKRKAVRRQSSERQTGSDDEAEAKADGFGHRVGVFLAQFAVFFALGFVLMMFAPQRMKTIEATIRRQPVLNFVAGFAAMVALVPVTLVLAITVIGIPVAVVMWLAVAVSIFGGMAAIANAVGVNLPVARRRKTQAMALALGLLVLLGMAQLPVLGGLVVTVAGLIAFGAMVRTRFGQPRPGVPMLDELRATV